MSQIQTKSFVYDDFADKCGEAFVLADGTALSLIECVALATPPASGRAFSLIFTAPMLLPQGLYRLRHEGLGTNDVFLVPVGKEAQGFLLQAIFN